MSPIQNIRVILVTLAMLCACMAEAVHPDGESREVYEYISETIGKTVRESATDSAGNFGLPRPFSVPCVRGAFQNMYYWDTYFTNAGLLALGDTAQAHNNIENIAAMVSRLGYMPNATCRELDNRSQPPLFCRMVADYYDATGDTSIIRQTYGPLLREYDFWMTRRMTPSGLNRYGHDADDAYLISFWRALSGRIGVDSGADTDSVPCLRGAHLLAEAESGWDFTPRFDRRCMDFAPVDLNAIMYGFEKDMGRFAALMGDDPAVWHERAGRRRELINSLLLGDDGLFYDYDYVNGRRSDILSAAVFTLLWNDVLTPAQAETVKDSLHQLETPHGIMACVPGSRLTRLQWDAPNGWAPIHFYVIKGLDNYGFRDDAARVSAKYIGSITAIYGLTGQLWEKFNAAKGNIDVNDEYPMPGHFMGWTAGAYITAYNYLNNSRQQDVN